MKKMVKMKGKSTRKNFKQGQAVDKTRVVEYEKFQRPSSEDPHAVDKPRKISMEKIDINICLKPYSQDQAI